MTDRSRPDPVSVTRLTDRQFRVGLAAISVIAAILRIGYLLRLRAVEVTGDGTYYSALGNLIADGEGFISALLHSEGQSVPSAFHPPAWSLVLGAASRAGLRTPFQHQFVAISVGVGLVVAVGCSARRIAGPRVGLIAAAVFAVPVFAAREWELLAEPIAMLGTTILLGLVYRFRERPGSLLAVALGAGIGILSLIRSDLVLLMPLVMAPIVLGRTSVSWRTRSKWLAMGTVTMILMISPWASYNASRFRETVLLSTQLGPTLVEANCDSTYFGKRLGFGDGDCRRAVRENRIRANGDESTRDLAMRAVALRYIRQHIGRLPVVVLAREGRAWGVFRVPQQIMFETDRGTPYRYVQASFLVHWLLLGAAVPGLVVMRRRRIAVYPLLAVIALAACSIALTFGSTRYRAVAEVPIVIMAAAALDSCLTRLRSATNRRLSDGGPRSR